MKSTWRKHLIIRLFLGLLAVPIYFLDLAVIGGSSGSDWIRLDFPGTYLLDLRHCARHLDRIKFNFRLLKTHTPRQRKTFGCCADEKLTAFVELESVIPSGSFSF